MQSYAQIMEALMIICFGGSWPISICKSLKTRSARGKSLPFMLMVESGYVCGIVGKLLSGNITWVFFIYLINLCMVGTDILLYFRNKRLDQLAEKT
ncbi:MAG: hypothetical protein E7324_05005 [Clostridiales bacterium]|nr:hypothetical protein [Clostridiales bacterium]